MRSAEIRSGDRRLPHAQDGWIDHAQTMSRAIPGTPLYRGLGGAPRGDQSAGKSLLLPETDRFRRAAKPGEAPAATGLENYADSVLDQQRDVSVDRFFIQWVVLNFEVAEPGKLQQGRDVLDGIVVYV